MCFSHRLYLLWGRWEGQTQKSPSWCLCNLKWGSKLKRQKRWSFIHHSQEGERGITSPQMNEMLRSMNIKGELFLYIQRLLSSLPLYTIRDIILFTQSVQTLINIFNESFFSIEQRGWNFTCLLNPRIPFEFSFHMNWWKDMISIFDQP